MDKAQKVFLAEGAAYRKGRELTKTRGQFIDLAPAKVREGSGGETWRGEGQYESVSAGAQPVTLPHLEPGTVVIPFLQIWKLKLREVR